MKNFLIRFEANYTERVHTWCINLVKDQGFEYQKLSRGTYYYHFVVVVFGMVSNFLLDIYVYTYRLVLFSALVRETSVSCRQ